MPGTSELREQPRGYEFGPFRVDVHGGAVYRGEKRLPLMPKAVDLLCLLLAARGEVVTRDDLLREVWPEVVVEEGNISKLVHQLRQAFEDVPGYAEAIETVHKRGYRFVGEVREIGGAPPPDTRDRGGTVLPLPPPVRLAAGFSEPEPAAGAARRWWVVGTAMTTVVLALLLWSYAHRGVPSAALDRRSIAVLPFKNLGEERVDPYFGDGLAEDIVIHLARVPGLRVVSRASTQGYRDPAPPLRTIGSELGVGAVIEGSVRRTGGRARITIKLTETATGSHLWAETYDRDVQDVLGVQSDVAGKVAGVLALRIDRKDEMLLRGGTRQPEAYDLYLRGLAELDRWLVDDSMRSAIEHLERAVALDPSFARAHAQLAWAHARAGLQPNVDDSWFEKTRTAADRALELEPALALPHVARSFLLWSWQGGWDAEGAISELRQAQGIEPGIGHLELGVLFAHLGLDEAARRELDQALSYNPRSHWIRDRVTRSYFWLARDSEALARARDWFTEQEVFLIAWESAVRQGHASEVLRVADPAKDKWWRPKRAMALAATGGSPKEARENIRSWLEAMGSKHSNWHHFAYDAACVEALLGEHDAAVRLLREVASGGFPDYLLFSADPFLDSLRSHPGFIELMAELKPTWEQRRARYR